MKKWVHFVEIGPKHSYESVWEFQQYLQQQVIANKRSQKQFRPNYLLFCEHQHVYTLGKSGTITHLKSDKIGQLPEKPTFHKVNRGGDITYHGPGQITGYPIFDMDQFYHDLHRYVCDLEEVIIRCLDHFGLKGTRIKGLTGVWLDHGAEQRKICAIGVHMSRWVSMHGFALNVNTSLDYYRGIVPCGISEMDKDVTSMSRELGRTMDRQIVVEALKKEFSEVFEFNYF